MKNEFTTQMTYQELRQIVFNYFKEVDNIELGSASIEYFEQYLRGEKPNPKFFIMKNEIGESRFDIPKEDIEKILAWYLKKNNFEFVSAKYDYRVNISYKMNFSLDDDKKEEPENKEQENSEPESKEQSKSSSLMHM